MEEIKLIGADFNSGMPKWATDDALKKLTKSIENNQKYSKKIDDKTLKLLATLAKNDQDQAKVSKEIIKQLKLSNSKSDKLISTLEKTNTQLSKVGDEIANSSSTSQTTRTERVEHQVDVQAKLDSTELLKGFGTYLNVTNKLLYEINTAVNNSASSFSEFDISNIELPEVLIQNNTSTTEIANVLDERLSEMHRVIASGMRHRNVQTGQPRSNRALNAVGRGTSRVLGEITSQLSGFAKKLPVIGAIITGLTSIAAALSFVGSSIKNASWDYQKEYKEMMVKGFSFSVETLDEQIKMDGIRLRSMMTQTGMTIEDSMKLLEKNAILVNYMGVDKFAKTIGDVADSQNEHGVKFVDQMMMSREQLGEFTTQYLATARYMGQTELLNSEMRTRAAQQYIKDAKMFGQVVGVGLEQIIQSVEALKKTSDWALKTAHMDTTSEEYKVLEQAAMAFNGMNIPDQMKQVLSNALLDPRGLGLQGSDEGKDFYVGLQKLGLDTYADRLNEMIKDVSMGRMSQEDFNKELIEIQKIAADTKITKENAQSVALSGNENEKVAALFHNQIKTLDTKHLKQSDTTDHDKSSGVAQKQTEAESAITKAQNAAEKMVLDAMDSQASREALEYGLTAMKNAATTTEAIIAGNQSIIAVLIEKFDSLMDLIVDMFSSLPFVNSPIEDKREVLIERIYEDRDSDLAQNEQLQSQLKKELEGLGVKFKEGFLTADITDGGLFSTGVNEQAIKNAGLDQDSIIEKVSTLETPEEFKEMALTLAKLANTKAIRDDDRQVYAEMLEGLLDAKDEDGKIAEYVAKSMEAMTRQTKSDDLVPNEVVVSESSLKSMAKNQDQKPKYEESFSKPSPVAETAQTANKQLEEQKKANEEAKRQQAELIQQQRSEKEKTETTTTIKQEEAEEKNNDSVILDGLMLVAGQLEQITRLLNNAVNDNKKGKDII